MPRLVQDTVKLWGLSYPGKHYRLRSLVVVICAPDWRELIPKLHALLPKKYPDAMSVHGFRANAAAVRAVRDAISCVFLSLCVFCPPLARSAFSRPECLCSCAAAVFWRVLDHTPIFAPFRSSSSRGFPSIPSGAFLPPACAGTPFCVPSDQSVCAPSIASSHPPLAGGPKRKKVEFLTGPSPFEAALRVFSCVSFVQSCFSGCVFWRVFLPPVFFSQTWAVFLRQDWCQTCHAMSWPIPWILRPPTCDVLFCDHYEVSCQIYGHAWCQLFLRPPVLGFARDFPRVVFAFRLRALTRIAFLFFS